MTAKRGKLKKPPLERAADARASQVSRTVPPAEVVSSKELVNLAHAAQFREIASIEYIVDPNQNTLEWHYARTDRPWRKHITLATLRSWAEQDHWDARRKEYAEQVRTRVLERHQNQAVKKRLSQLDELEEIRSYTLEYLRPMRDKDGKARRYPMTVRKGKGHEPHPLAGLPVFPLELGNLGTVMKRFIELERHMMTIRGELPDRQDDATEAATPVTALLPPGTEITSAEVRVLTRALLRERQPDLQEQPEIAVKPSHGKQK